MPTTTATAAEAEVLAAVDALFAAVMEDRLDDYFESFVPDASFLFPGTPERIASITEYRDLWRTWVRDDAFEVTACASSRPLVQVVGDTAVFTHHVETTVRTQAGAETSYERQTIVFTRTGGRWLAVHEHLSAVPRT
jgi:ketosteroid isomerase-like protein